MAKARRRQLVCFVLLGFLVGVTQAVEQDHFDEQTTGCRNFCYRCGYQWAFDVADSSEEVHYCYTPDITVQAEHRCFGDDAHEAIGCNSIHFNRRRRLLPASENVTRQGADSG